MKNGKNLKQNTSNDAHLALCATIEQYFEHNPLHHSLLYWCLVLAFWRWNSFLIISNGLHTSVRSIAQGAQCTFEQSERERFFYRDFPSFAYYCIAARLCRRDMVEWISPSACFFSYEIFRRQFRSMLFALAQAGKGSIRMAEKQRRIMFSPSFALFVLALCSWFSVSDDF